MLLVYPSAYAFVVSAALATGLRPFIAGASSWCCPFLINLTALTSRHAANYKSQSQYVKEKIYSESFAVTRLLSIYFPFPAFYTIITHSTVKGYGNTQLFLINLFALLRCIQQGNTMPNRA